MAKDPMAPKKGVKTPYKVKAYKTKNNTQLFSKDHFGTEKSVAQTTEEMPSGEQGLPDLH